MKGKASIIRLRAAILFVAAGFCACDARLGVAVRKQHGASCAAGGSSCATPPEPQTPATPTNVAPFEIEVPPPKSNGASLTFAWSQVPNAAAYVFTLAEDMPCTVPILRREGLADTSVTLTGLAEGAYYICVDAAFADGKVLRAKNSGVSFRVKTTAPGAFAIVDSPSTAFGPMRPLTWQSATGASYYEIRLAHQPDCGDVGHAFPQIPATTVAIGADVPEGAWHACVTAWDDYGNSQPASNTGLAITVDRTGPVLTWTRDPGLSPVLGLLPAVFTVTASEALAAPGLRAADIAQDGTASGVTWSVTAVDPLHYRLAATAVTGAGTVIPRLPAGKVTDLAGNPNAVAAANTEFSYPTRVADFLNIMAYRSDVTTPALDLADPTVLSGRKTARMAEEARGQRPDAPSLYRFVPHPKFDTADGFGNVDGRGPGLHSLETIAGRPTVACGGAGTVDARIADCASANGARATWDGAVYGQEGEGLWRLVSVVSANGVTWETWRDERTKLLWSDSTLHLGADGAIGGTAANADVGGKYNWFQAAGYSCAGASCPGGANSSVAATGMEGAAGQGTACAAAACQPATPVSVCADPASIAGLRGVATYNGPASLAFKANLSAADGVHWRLPSASDWMVAAANGAKKVLPNMGRRTDGGRGTMFWTSTTDSGYANGTTASNAAVRFSGSHGEIPSIQRNNPEPVRCVAGVDDATALAAEPSASLRKLLPATGHRGDNAVDFADPAALAARPHVDAAEAAWDAGASRAAIPLVPDPRYASDDRFLNGSPGPAPRRNYLQTVACRGAETAPCRPTLACGGTGGIEERIADCAAKNGPRATWDGKDYGTAGEGLWRLVVVRAGSGVNWEVWRDEATLLLWSDGARHVGPDNLRNTADDVGPYVNWFQASGFSCAGAGCPTANSSVNWTQYEGAAGQGSDCGGAPCQPAVPVSYCAEASLLAGAHGVATYADGNMADAKGGLNATSTPRVLWRLPTQNEWGLAMVNGARHVLPNMDFGYWSSTSSPISLASAIRVSGTNGYEDAQLRNVTNLTVRCIGVLAP